MDLSASSAAYYVLPETLARLDGSVWWKVRSGLMNQWGVSVQPVGFYNMDGIIDGEATLPIMVPDRVMTARTIISGIGDRDTVWRVVIQGLGIMGFWTPYDPVALLVEVVVRITDSEFIEDFTAIAGGSGSFESIVRGYYEAEGDGIVDVVGELVGLKS